MLNLNFWILSHLSLNSGTQILIPVFSCFQVSISSFESLDQTTTKLKLTSEKGIHFKPMYFLQRIATSNTSVCKQDFENKARKLYHDRALARALPKKSFICFQCLNFSWWILSHLSLNRVSQILISFYVFHLDITSSFTICILCFNPVPQFVFVFVLSVFICNICSKNFSLFRFFIFIFYLIGWRTIALYGTRFYDDDDDDDDNNNNNNDQVNAAWANNNWRHSSFVIIKSQHILHINPIQSSVVFYIEIRHLTFFDVFRGYAIGLKLFNVV